MATVSRRETIAAAGAGLAALSGCTTVLGSGQENSEQLHVGWVPIYPNVQHFVMSERDYYAELDAELSTTEFSSGPAAVKAFAAGDLDIGFFGVTPAMVLTDNGVDADVLVANSKNGFKMIATDGFADRYDDDGGDAFQSYTADHGTKPIWGTAPDGSVPDIITRYWIERDLEAGATTDVVNKAKVPPAKTPQAAQSGDIVGTTVQEPYATLVAEMDGYRQIEWSGTVLPDHPVTVAFVANSVSNELKRGFVEQHIRATNAVYDDPTGAAQDAAAVLGLDEALAERAMQSKAAAFLSDPHEITSQSETMSKFVAEVGNIDGAMSAAELFDVSVYDTVA
ncbi:CmpA/NrtA family ABC transporter substrate-binding protein [Halogeometricum borinquense]|uniref:ABC-type nitrate/sulfonate/bicarbonate transport system, periplasmic component n=2 Tax=Halogeometricum borinquense (strain ATCC 700274 / DSM 11551 / JCM 10706 / KCTC 4070 / PR3) TaxID=469382 RepID=E4NUL1_HALBP|nr:CmpA/NrtA family ABC transporter substrate-binding protein [Halogeometricum borinquense]ADQ68731.1 ABC-type nitrate/sulfonate/bicarbonate transport system, periplasmic component [Halogeometricum borinquense DSM 11551]